MAYSALEKPKKDFGIEFKCVEPDSPFEDKKSLENLVKNKYDIIVDAGFLM